MTSYSGVVSVRYWPVAQCLNFGSVVAGSISNGDITVCTADEIYEMILTFDKMILFYDMINFEYAFSFIIRFSKTITQLFSLNALYIFYYYYLFHFYFHIQKN